MKQLKSLLFTIAFAVLAGILTAPIVGASVVAIAGGITAISFIPTGSGSGVAYAGIYREVWTGEMVKRFTHEATFLERIPDQSRYVDNDVIHLIDIGVHPDVLINNTTYPLTPQDLGNDDIAISIPKFETVPTSITNDELYAITYNKIQAAMDIHREALQMATGDKAAHAIAPNSNTTDTPIVETSGGDNGDGFNRMEIDNIISLKKKFDDLKLPKVGRILVLSSQHVNDLLLTSQSFRDQYYDISEGKIAKLFGFEIYEYINTPVYDGTTKVKKAYGAAAAGTDLISSFAFINNEIFKAKGSTVSYLQEAKSDVLNKRNLLSYDLRFVALPKKARAIGAIINKVTA